jgi:hypothetical protein
MKPLKDWKLSDALTWWKVTGFVVFLWLVSVLIFSDLCLSFGGGNNSGCHSHFNYPEFVALMAIVFTASGPAVILFLLLVSTVLSIRKYFSSQRLKQGP